VGYGGGVAGGVRLGVDFGTSTTVAVLAVDDRATRPLLFDGSPLLPSAVWADPSGRLLVGQDALRSAVADPAALEAHPKRCVDDGTVLLGAAEIGVGTLFRAVLDRVVAAAEAVAGPIDEMVVTCPAAWGAPRRGVLASVLPAGARLVSEPVAAASYFVGIAGAGIADGQSAVVYDFGAGTFDASVVRRTPDGFVVAATLGRPDSGGLDIDAAIIEHFAASVPDEAAWGVLRTPSSSRDRRARQQLWDNVRNAKEMLSRITTTLVHLPVLDVEVPLGREELDRLAAPVLARTVETTREVLRQAGVEPAEVAAIFLSGGSSRMPAVVTTLHRAFGRTPTTAGQPELVVAEGSLRAGAEPDESLWPDPPPTVPLAAPRRRPVRFLTAAGATAALVVVAVAAVAVRSFGDDHERAGTPTTATSAAAAPSPSPSPSKTYPPTVDPCLLGTWRSEGGTSYDYAGNTQVMFVVPPGDTYEYREDGVAVFTDKPVPRYAEFQGSRYETTFTGVSTFRWSTGDGLLQLTLLESSSTYVQKRNGRQIGSGKAVYKNEPAKYTCNEKTLQITSTLGHWSMTASRTPGP
jgi:hypothetical protein